MTIIVTADQAGQSVGMLLKRHYGVSTTLLNRIKRRKGALTKNGEPVFTNAVVFQGDVLFADLSDPAAEEAIVPIPMPLDIRYEDEDLLILNKSAPLAVHASSFAPDEPTLANALAHYLGSAFTLHPVNRLDRGTTGLMVIAKSQYVHNLLRQQLHTACFYREYRGIALGNVVPASAQINLPIARAEGSPIKRCVKEDGLPSLSEYEVLSAADDLTLLRLIPHTGRTHQLRLHMASVGHPLLGDWLYGQEDRSRIARPALHSAVLRMRHPTTGVPLELTAPLPADMAVFFPHYTTS